MMTLLICRFGGWSVANASTASLDFISTVGGTLDNVMVWFNNKADHALPSYVSATSNAILRSMVQSMGLDPAEFGISTYVHPMMITNGQLNARTL
jgi:hypothetical protein